MIERNLGNAERVIRLTLAILFMIWAFGQEAINGVEILVVVVATLLMLNGLFSRCYFWYILDLNSMSEENRHCS